MRKLSVSRVLLPKRQQRITNELISDERTAFALIVVRVDKGIVEHRAQLQRIKTIYSRISE